MNRLRLLAPVVLFACVGTAQAQRSTSPSYPRPVDRTSLVTSDVFDSLANAFSYYHIRTQSLTYDPVSGVLATVLRGYGDSLDNVYLRTSTDLGKTWSTSIGPLDADAVQNGKGRYPSMAIINMQGSNDPSQLYYYYSFPVTQNDEFGRVMWGLIEANGNPIVIPTSDDGVSGGRGWSTDATTIISKDNNVLVTLGSVDKNALAMRRFDVAQSNYTAVVPPQWETSNFYSNATDPTASYSSWAGAGRDENNIFYAGGLCLFADQATRGPRPGISTSSDAGATWSDFNKLPVEVIQSYLNANAPGVIEDSSFINYIGDFCVSSSDHCHFFINLFETNASKPETETFAHLVEATYSGGQWTLRKIADGSGRYYILRNDDKDTARENQMQNETEFSLTADHTKLLAKWTDQTAYIFEADIDNDGDSPDTVGTTDVFVAVRSLPDGNWSQPLNITESPLLDRITHIPDVIPNDLSNVPMLAVQTIVNDPTSLYDSIFTEQTFVGGPQHVLMENFDATSIAGVDSRNGAAAPTFHLESPTPNPARDRALVMFSLQQGSEVRIDLVAADGSIVSTPVQERYDAGNHGVAVDTRALPNGSYQVVMKASGTQASKQLVVMH